VIIFTTTEHPRIVGETGGKDFVIAHPSANVEAVATALVEVLSNIRGRNVLQLQELIFLNLFGLM
jgi:hypothetical protein